MLITKKSALTSLIITVFITINLAFIFLQIHKQSQFVKLSYGHQRLEKQHGQLSKQRNDLVHQLYVQQSRKNVQNYATDHLKMRPTSVKQIHKITLS